MPLLTQAEIARLHGVSRQAISKQKGALRVSKRKRGGKTLYDSDVFDKERSDNQDPAKKKGARVSDQDAPGVDSNQDYKTARAWVERYKAANQKLLYEIKTGKYILKSHVKDANFKAGRIFRDALLNIGPRVASILAAESDEHKVLEILKVEFTSALNEMVKALNDVVKKGG